MKLDKTKIIELFKNRVGFTDEVIDVIFTCYLFLDNKFKSVVLPENIPDESSFLIKPDYKNGRSIANIFINRIYNNVLTITNKTTASGQYFPLKKMIALSDAPLDLQHYKKLNLTTSQLHKIQKQLRAKIIAHELFHASCDNGIGIGFLLRADMLGETHQNIIKKLYTDSSQISADSSRPEEIITEMLALDAIGINTPCSITSNNIKINYSIMCRNINSSNAPLNALGEYFVRCFDSVTYGKFTDGFLWLANFSKLHTYFGTTQNHFAHKLNNDFKFIANYFDSNTISYAQKSLKLIIKHQSAMLKYYIDNLKINSREDTIKLIKDYMAFVTFSVKQNETIPAKLQTLLDLVKESCILHAKKYGVDIDKILNTEKPALNLCTSFEAEKAN